MRTTRLRESVGLARALLNLGTGTDRIEPEEVVILDFNFEEIRALSAGAELLLDSRETRSSGTVAAPPEAISHVALLKPRLNGALSIESLDEQRQVRRAVAAICQLLHDRMDEMVLQYHPAHEEAVAYYFDYAHAFGVLGRLDAMGVQMSAMIELITGSEPTDSTARMVSFPD